MFVASGVHDQVNLFCRDPFRPDMDERQVPRQVMDFDHTSGQRTLDVEDLAVKMERAVAMDLPPLLHAEEHIELGHMPEACG